MKALALVILLLTFMPGLVVAQELTDDWRRQTVESERWKRWAAFNAGQRNVGTASDRTNVNLVYIGKHEALGDTWLQFGCVFSDEGLYTSHSVWFRVRLYQNQTLVHTSGDNTSGRGLCWNRKKAHDCPWDFCEYDTPTNLDTTFIEIPIGIRFNRHEVFLTSFSADERLSSWFVRKYYVQIR